MTGWGGNIGAVISPHQSAITKSLPEMVTALAFTAAAKLTTHVAIINRVIFFSRLPCSVVIPRIVVSNLIHHKMISLRQ